MKETKFSIDKALILDVREIISQGTDPFSIIMDKVNNMKEGDVLNVINVFEPIPLINKLTNDGFEYFIDRKGEDFVSTYFKKYSKVNIKEISSRVSTSGDFEKVKNFFANNIVEIDVRNLEMPEPMVKILQNIEILKADWALFVHHKKVPQYLLPELDSKKMKYLIHEIDNSNVKLLIFR